MPDARALSILFNTYWGPKGWKEDPVWDPFAAPPTPPKADFAHAKKCGVMFDHRHVSRSDAVKWCLKSVRSVAAPQVADAFVSSLRSQRLDLRSALGSYAIGRRFPKHKCKDNEDTDGYCTVCGQLEMSPEVLDDLNVLNFERHKWGGVRHAQCVYIGLDLELFAKEAPTNPTDDDKSLLCKILSTADRMPARATPTNLAKELGGLFKSTNDERRTLITILGYAGILQPPAHPSYRTAWINYADRPEHHTEWEFPIAWWRGKDGVNAAAVKEWFPWAKRSPGAWTISPTKSSPSPSRQRKPASRAARIRRNS